MVVVVEDREGEMGKKSNISETLFATLCMLAIAAVLVVNNIDALAAWLAIFGGLSVGDGGSFAQAAIGFLVVSVLGGTVLWFRRPAPTLDADGNPVEVDYSSPDWIRVEVIR